MLCEICSPVFKIGNNTRKPIEFKKGLNVVLGKEDAENSIGKSSALLAIDFAFGGNSYIKSDCIPHVGHHDVNFAFEFNGERFYFKRSTDNADYFYVCNEDYISFGKPLSKNEFISWLQDQYKIQNSGLKFRQALSAFFRIYGKDNANEIKPLLSHIGESNQDSINRLITLFNLYSDIEFFTKALEEEKNKLDAYHKARKYRFVSDLVGGKAQFEENCAKIKELENQLKTLTNTQSSGCSAEEIEKSQKKNQLLDDKISIERMLQSKKRKERLLNLSIEYGLYPSEADLNSLQEYFPEVDVRKLYEVEKYHKKIAAIMGQQFAAEKETINSDILSLENQIRNIQEQIKELGVVGTFSKDFLDKHSEIQSDISLYKTQNDAYLLLLKLQDAKNAAVKNLKKATETALQTIECKLNEKMHELNASLYSESRKAPKVTLKEYNSYSFETPDDRGTGSNYKGMIIYDLAVFSLTNLPAIAHDSFLLKNVGDRVIDGLMKIYARSEKQVFIAFDKHESFSDDTRHLLEDNCVLRLSDNGGEFYGLSWNKEETN